MIVTNIKMVTILVILFLGIPILYNTRKADFQNPFSFIDLIKIINKSLKIQGITGLILSLLSWIWSIADFMFDRILIQTTYTYLVVGFFMYLPALAFLNFIKFIIERKLEKNKIIGNQKIDDLDKSYRKEIIEKFKERLERNLTKEELYVFNLQRSGIAYEMIMDYISDKKLSKTEIEIYIQKVVEENQK